MNSACPRRVSLITAKGTAVHSVSNHRRNDRGSPGCQRIYSRPDRLRLSLADSPLHTDRIEFTATSHPGTPVLRTGRSRCVALHPGLLRRSYGSIPHGSSPHRGGLSPPYPLALSGARTPPSGGSLRRQPRPGAASTPRRHPTQPLPGPMWRKWLKAAAWTLALLLSAGGHQISPSGSTALRT